MEEKKTNVSNINIKGVKALYEAGKVGALLSSVKQAKQGLNDINKRLGEKQQELKRRQEAEKADASVIAENVKTDADTNVEVKSEVSRVENKTASVKEQVAEKIDISVKAEKTQNVETSSASQEKAETAKQPKTEKTVKVEKEVSVKADDSQKAESVKKSTEKVEKVEETAKPEAKTQKTEKVAEQAPQRQSQATVTIIPGANPGDEPKIVRPKYVAPVRPVFTPRTRENAGSLGEKPAQRREYVPSENRRPNNNGQNGRSWTPGQRNGQGGYQGNGGQRGGYQGNGTGYQGGRNNFQNKDGQSRPPFGQGGQRDGQSRPPFGQRPFSPRPQAGGAGAGISLSFIPKDTKTFANKKKQGEKSYEEKHTINKKQLLKGELSVEDFDENKSGYRKLRTKKTQKSQEEQHIKIEKAVVNKEIIPIKELCEKLGISAVEVTKILFKEGIIKTINDSVDYDTAGFVAASLNIELELKLDKTAEDVLTEGFNEEADNPDDYVKRPPVVTVMGHVDHGKTSLLDKIRQTNVTAGEAGGITQHIGAYSVSLKGNKITFLDTPGHAAFTAMRARGAQVTDVAIIVIAADDGIMPQTIEAINHAKAANVSIIIAANKVDKPHADIDRLRQQLTEQGLVVEEWGGDTMLVPVSAKTGDGVDKLLDAVLLVADMRELKANPKRKAKGVVVEAKLDKGKGPVATIIVQNGTLRAGDNIVAGTIVGKVRAMFDDKGRMVKEAGPSMAVSILGLDSVPNAGDPIFAVEEEKLTKLVAEERKNKAREDMVRQQQKVSLDELFSKISDGDLKRLNLIIKADVQGSVEAVKQSLEELSTPAVQVSVIHAGVGAISETDVMLADSSNSIIIGFNVRPDANAKVLAERSKVDVKLYRIIYEAIDDIKLAMSGLLAPKFNDVYMGKAEVRDVFKITGVGMVAGCYVTEGKIVRTGKLRIYREDVMICEGNVMQLKRFKDDVKEVAQGYECGISIENFNDIKVGDFIECYVVEEQKVK